MAKVKKNKGPGYWVARTQLDNVGPNRETREYGDPVPEANDWTNAVRYERAGMLEWVDEPRAETKTTPKGAQSSIEPVTEIEPTPKRADGEGPDMPPLADPTDPLPEASAKKSTKKKTTKKARAKKSQG